METKKIYRLGVLNVFFVLPFYLILLLLTVFTLIGGAYLSFIVLLTILFFFLWIIKRIVLKFEDDAFVSWSLFEWKTKHLFDNICKVSYVPTSVGAIGPELIIHYNLNGKVNKAYYPCKSKYNFVDILNCLNHELPLKVFDLDALAKGSIKHIGGKFIY